MPPRSKTALPEPQQVVDSNVLELPSKKKKKAVVEEVKKKKPLTKSQQRKLKRMLEEKAMAAKRAHNYEVLAQQQLSDSHRALMDSSARMGQKDTMKQKLKLAFLRQQAGIQTEEDRQLLEVERPVEEIDSRDFESLVTKERAAFQIPLLSASTNASTTSSASDATSSLDTSKMSKKQKRKAAQKQQQQQKLEEEAKEQVTNGKTDTNKVSVSSSSKTKKTPSATSFFDAVLTQINSASESSFPSSLNSTPSSSATTTSSSVSSSSSVSAAVQSPAKPSLRSVKKKRKSDLTDLRASAALKSTNAISQPLSTSASTTAFTSTSTSSSSTTSSSTTSSSTTSSSSSANDGQSSLSTKQPTKKHKEQAIAAAAAASSASAPNSTAASSSSLASTLSSTTPVKASKKRSLDQSSTLQSTPATTTPAGKTAATTTTTTTTTALPSPLNVLSSLAKQKSPPTTPKNTASVSSNKLALKQAADKILASISIDQKSRINNKAAAKNEAEKNQVSNAKDQDGEEEEEDEGDEGKIHDAENEAGDEGDVENDEDEGDDADDNDDEGDEEEDEPRVRDPKPGRWMGSGLKKDEEGPKGAYSVGFKVWGAKQRKRTPFVLPPSTETTTTTSAADVSTTASTAAAAATFAPRSSIIDSLPAFEASSEIPQEQKLFKSLLGEAEPTPLESTTCVIHVNRDPEMAKSRQQLPIYSQEQEIVELVRYNDVSIICGETGSGKTTQVPQFLLENGYSKERDTPAFQQRSVLVPPFPGMIGVTQPRRVAAVSTANRIARELNLGETSSSPSTTNKKSDYQQLDVLAPQLPPTLVAYQIRYDSKVDEQTRIKLMTDGILLKEIQQDFLLQKYSVLILDEAHERGINTDVLIGLLSRIVVLRKKKAVEYDTTKKGDVVYPLKLVIMSATLRVDDFVSNTRLFPLTRPPVLNIPARQFKVVDHFSRRTPVSLGEATEKVFAKVCQAHMRLPQGGILVFLTGRHEIEVLCRRLRETFQAKTSSLANGEEVEGDQHASNNKINNKNGSNDSKNTDTSSDQSMIDEEEAQDDALDTDSEDEGEAKPVEESDGKLGRELAEFMKNDQRTNVCVLPLYSILPTHQQLKVFQPVAAGHRLIVVATNVAETSLTIPGIKYVIDTGREKTRTYDKVTGTSRFEVTWISKASARQRSGRAGRTAPGHCYRLYSGPVFAEFLDHTVPEILRTPIEDVVLQMKHMSIDNVASFPFPTPPDDESLQIALRTLKILGAIENASEKITELGKSLAQFPLSPRLGKMLLLAHQGGCVPFVIAIVASLSVNELWSSPTHVTEKDLQEDKADSAADEGKASKRAKTSSAEDGEDDKATTRAIVEEDNSNDEEAKKQKALREKRRAQSLAYNEARQRWGHDRSDLLTNLRVFGGFLFCTAKKKNVAIRLAKQLEFCDKNFVRHKALLEMESLAKQLSRIARQLSEPIAQDQEHLREEDGGEVEESGDFEMQVPSSEQEELLCQIICTGFIDRICRQMPESEKNRIIKSQPEWDDKLHGAYQAASMPSTPVFIHPASQLFPRAAQPEWLCYHELIATSSKHYLRGLTAISAEWIADLAGTTCPLIERSKPLENPMPRYDSKKDCVMATAETRFGFPDKGLRWTLPLSEIEHPLGLACEKQFARLLLQGDVFPQLKEFRVYLLSRPSDLFQPILPKKAITLLRSLHCTSRKQLLNKNQTDLDHVVGELCQWFQPSVRGQLNERLVRILKSARGK